MAKESSTDIRNTDSKLIVAECGVKYPGINKSSRHEIYQNLISQHSRTTVNSVIGPLRDWKVTSYANFARTHERMFKQAYGLEASERNEDLISRDPTDDELEVVKSVREISTDYFDSGYGSSVTVYRGISYSVPELLKGFLSNSDEDSTPIETTVLSNFTTIPEIAKSYGILTISMNIPTDCIAVAADQLFLFERKGDLYCPEGEIRLFGEHLPELPRSNLIFPSTAEPVVDRLKNPNEMTTDEHSTMEDVITVMSDKCINITDVQMESILWNWFDVYKEQAGFEAKNRVLTIEKLINSSIRSESTG